MVLCSERKGAEERFSNTIVMRLYKPLIDQGECMYGKCDDGSWMALMIYPRMSDISEGTRM